MATREELMLVPFGDLIDRLIEAEARIEAMRPKVRKLNELEAAGVDNWEGYGAVDG